MSKKPYNETFFLRGEQDRERFVTFARHVPLGEPLTVKVTSKAETRSAQQNRLYWKWIGILSNETGDDKDALHEFFMRKFLTPKIATVGGEVIEIYSSKSLPVKEMSAYMDQLHAFATGWGYYLPVPEDMHLRDAS